MRPFIVWQNVGQQWKYSGSFGTVETAMRSARTIAVMEDRPVRIEDRRTRAQVHFYPAGQAVPWLGMYCRVCGCTDEDCSGCIERTGDACYWIEPGLCSACEFDAKGRSRRSPTKPIAPRKSESRSRP